MNKVNKYRFYESIGLRELRRSRGLSVEAAALLIGIKEDQLCRYEENPSDTPVSLALRIASVLNCDYDLITFAEK
ncbi:helix-turn-helix domain-containing protein [Paenibacillus sp. FSL R5-808]|jgi:predicted transcriptional regulator|uniref:helix-turn-helix domain-containing protein n=1 Tax=Paenibacillus sp. FSL R5-808 TaxID=1227076 RepID=UPI0003E1F8B0|nr:helix-turn-helix transcriptional regulator [Paenibacillus sp. FSL R5-808]ETT33595.1 XRE family transcriptional regulator [Paenibacillus sp. FSL R5-808]